MSVKFKSSGAFWTLILMSSLFLAGIVAVACGGSSSTTTTTTGSTTGTANVMLSDPATCAGPSGLFSHVYVTITDVQANISSSAELLLSSESKTGVKIPSGQIASGSFTIAEGQTKDLDIDFNTCASIVTEGNGQYRLKPVLHAGEVSTTSTSINGKVLDSTTGNPVNGEVTVALEQKDASGVDRILMSTLAGNDGSFVFCPIPTRGPTTLLSSVKTCTEPRNNLRSYRGGKRTDHRKCQPVQRPRHHDEHRRGYRRRNVAEWCESGDRNRCCSQPT
jgi:hypothetical protein